MKFTQLLNENKNIPQDILKKFGEILFGEFQNKEDDTTYEEKLFFLINNWVTGDYMEKRKTPKLLNTYVNELIKLKKYYPELKPNILNLQRAVILNDNNIKTHKYMLDDIVRFDKKTKIYYSKKNTIYKPHGDIQSWTNDTSKYTKDLTETTAYAIVKHKFKNDELLFNMEFMNKINKFFNLPKENEILHIGKETIKCEFTIVDKKLYLPVYIYTNIGKKYFYEFYNRLDVDADKMINNF